MWEWVKLTMQTWQQRDKMNMYRDRFGFSLPRGHSIVLSPHLSQMQPHPPKEVRMRDFRADKIEKNDYSKYMSPISEQPCQSDLWSRGLLISSNFATSIEQAAKYPVFILRMCHVPQHQCLQPFLGLFSLDENMPQPPLRKGLPWTKLPSKNKDSIETHTWWKSFDLFMMNFQQKFLSSLLNPSLVHFPGWTSVK